MTNERLEELLLINSKVDGEDYSILKEFLETSPFVRISYLLKLKYYHSSINEKEYRNFNNNNNVDDKEVFNFEIKLTRYKTIEILTKILNNNYSIERKDITNFLEYKELYLLLFSFMNDIKVVQEYNPYLISIYKNIEKNLNIVKTFSLESFDSIYKKTSDPFDNDAYLKKCLETLDSKGKIDCSEIFLDSDKRAGKSNTITIQRYSEISMKYMKKLFDIILKYLDSPLKEKYFDNGFLEMMNETVKKEIENTTEQELFLIAMKIIADPNIDKNEFKRLVPNKSDYYYSFINSLRFLFCITGNEMNVYPFSNGLDKQYGESFSRIYINLPLNDENAIKILYQLVLKCAEVGFIPDMKASYSANPQSDKDSTILYIPFSKLSIVIDILKTIKKEHIEWFSTAGSPLWYCGQFDDISLAHMGDFEITINNMQFHNIKMSFTSYSDHIYRVAYSNMQEKISKMSHKPSNEERIEMYREELHLVHDKIQEDLMKKLKMTKNKNVPPFVKKVLSFPSKFKSKSGARNYLIDTYALEERRKSMLLDILFSKKNMSLVDNKEINGTKSL